MLTVVHVLALTLLTLAGLHRLVLTASYLRHRQPEPEPEAPARWPSVTVQIPLYDEKYVAARVIKAVLLLDYPKDLLDIQVLDDSTDETTAEVALLVEAAVSQGVRATHLRRGHRDGFKAGALAYGLERSSAEIFAVFDADFEPDPSFLRRTVGAFEDRTVGFVQARWEHPHPHSVLEHLEALMLDAHFTVEHHGRFSAGHFFNFNGTAGLLRRQALEEAGGWSDRTLTEDLDASYRMQLLGWRGIYLMGVTCRADLPARMGDFQRQQRRWAQGSIQVGRHLMGRIWKAPLSLGTRLEAMSHLMGPLIHPLLLAALAVIALGGTGGLEHWFLAAASQVALMGVLCFYSVAYREAGRGPLWALPAAVLGVLVLGTGLAVGNTVAVLRGALGTRDPFVRTPKTRSSGPRPAGYRSPVDLTRGFELVLGVQLASCVAWPAVAPHGMPWLMAVLGGAGFLWVALTATAEALEDLGA